MSSRLTFFLKRVFWMILFSAEAFLASSNSKFGPGVPLIEREAMNIIKSSRNEVSSDGSQQTMIALMAPLSLICASGHATGKTPPELDSLVRLAHTLAEDTLQHTTLKKPMFVSCCDAAWANRRHLTSQCGFLCAATEEDLMDGHAAPCSSISWHRKDMSQCRSKLEKC